MICIKDNLFNKFLSRLIYAYLILVCMVWGLMYYGGDRWLLGTLVLFGPRWLFLIPVPFLALVAVWRRKWKLLIALICSAWIAVVPLLDLRFHFKGPANHEGRPVRILTCNVAGNAFDGKKLLREIRDNAIDIAALQECPRDIQEKLPGNLHVVQQGELAVVSRFPLKDVQSVKTLHPPHKWPRLGALQCIVSLPGIEISFLTLHLPSPRYGLQHLMDRNKIIDFSKTKLLEEENANRWKSAMDVKAIVTGSKLPVIIAGDFNMPVQSVIYREAWHGFANVFSEVGNGYGWTEYNTFRGVPIAIRIDHILTGAGVVPMGCKVGPDIGSDHRPVIADVVLTR